MATYFLSSASGAGGAGNGSSWANAYLKLSDLTARTGPAFLAGDIIFMGDDHNETITLAANVTQVFPGTVLSPNVIYCMDHLVGAPGTNDLKTTGKINVNGAFQYSWQGGISYVYGVNLIHSAGLNNACNFLIVNGTQINPVLEKCTFDMATTNATGNIVLSSNSTFIECTFKTNLAGHRVQGADGITFIGCTFDNRGVTSTNFFLCTSAGIIEAIDCDFTALGASSILVASNTGGGQWTGIFRRCAFPTFGFQVFAAQAGGPLTNRYDFLQCSNGGTTYRNERWRANGNSIISLLVARVGGATDDATPISHKCITGAMARIPGLPFDAFPIAIWNSVVGTVYVTVEFIADPRIAEFAAIPKNDEVWFDVEYLGNASSVKGSRAIGGKANPLATGTAQTASTADWTAGSIFARGNNQSYGIGSLFKVASNPGRVFTVVSGGGNSAATEPPGYASLLDGQQITDGAVTVKAMWRFKQTIPITTTFAGLIYVQPRIAKPSLAGGIYIDPLITLS